MAFLRGGSCGCTRASPRRTHRPRPAAGSRPPLVRRLVRENVGQPGLGQIDHVDGHVVAPLGLGDEPPGHGWSEAALPGAADDDRQMNTVVGHWLLLYVTKSPVWSIPHSLNVPAGAPVNSSTVCVTTSDSVTHVACA